MIDRLVGYLLVEKFSSVDCYFFVALVWPRLVALDCSVLRRACEPVQVILVYILVLLVKRYGILLPSWRLVIVLKTALILRFELWSLEI